MRTRVPLPRQLYSVRRGIDKQQPPPVRCALTSVLWFFWCAMCAASLHLSCCPLPCGAWRSLPKRCDVLFALVCICETSALLTLLGFVFQCRKRNQVQRDELVLQMMARPVGSADSATPLLSDSSMSVASAVLRPKTAVIGACAFGCIACCGVFSSSRWACVTHRLSF